MKFRSIKFKITCWYAGIILLVFGVVVLGITLASEYYGQDKIKAELLDEVKDLREDILSYPDYFPREDLVSYYDDGVMLSIYDSDMNFINGVVPDGFPENIPFEENRVQKIKSSEDNWFISDIRVLMADGSTIWVRGIHSFSSIVLMFQRLLLLACICLPLLLIFTVFVGYRMIQRSLNPIHTIIKTADEIAASSDLSLRLPMPRAKDEFYKLSHTFNQMFGNLEQQFLREKQFSSDAAHELRTPVSSMLSHCEYCLQELSLSQEATEELQIIRQKALMMSRLVSQLLAISRAESKPYQPDFTGVDLSILAESVTEELEEKADARGIRLEIENSLKDPVITGDMELLTRMFINLIENAITYGKEHGYVKIRMEDEGSDVRLQFADNGIGIPPDSLNKIWDRFYQADPSHSMSEGFGLGLFMVKYIVNCHKGKINVKSTLSQGTVFTVVLPRKQGQ